MLIGEEKRFSLKERMINAIFIGVIIVDVTLLLSLNSAFSLNFVLAFISSIILSLTGYFSVRKWQLYTLGMICLCLLQLITIIMAWMELGGLVSLSPLTFMTAVVVDLHLLPKKYHSKFIKCVIVLFFVFVILEFNYPEIILETTKSPQVNLAIASIHWAGMLFFSISTIVLFKNEYDYTQSLLLKQKEELADLLEKEKELHHMKGEFVAMVSHQFRTPMTVIQSTVNLMELKLTKFFNGEHHLNLAKQFYKIYGALNNLSGIVDSVLSFETIESRNVKLNPVVLDLSSLVEDIIRNYPCSEEIIKTNLKCQGPSRNVLADPLLIEQSLTNLISNALKYDSQNRFPEISLHFKEHSVELLVSDRGIGIPKSEQNRLFTPFYRAENVSSIRGTGIGLFVVKNFVELHRGNISVQSEEGIGTTFKITLPVLVNQKYENEIRR
ncbi:sensor histidine kinase [Sediminitomix flava]|nr:HAMP domain-containing sensor histidine kinase [Sediminitomix flava]